MSKTWQNTVHQLALKERDRNSRARPYTGITYLDSPTSKQEGSPIIGTDTIKGCTNHCFRCYANRISRYHCKVFDRPVRCVVAGFPIPELVYRFGTFGDPAIDWDWTFRELNRLQELGMQRFYLLSKLQEVQGFVDNPQLCLHVSFDPLLPTQLRATMANFDVVNAHKVVRIKTIHSARAELMKRQEQIIAFAKQRNAPILETRFYTPIKVDLDLLKMIGYHRKGTLFKHPGSILTECFGLHEHLLCDRHNTGKCRDCLNCLALLP